MNPYPGLRPFRPDEGALFMGREVVLERVKTHAHISPLTVMFARSGVGKSSFLTCRLIPSLEKSCSVAYLNEWGSDSPEILVEQNLNFLSENCQHGEERPLLILDQFEDVFKLPFERENLWEKLAEVVNVFDATVHVLISMREEWLGVWGEAAEYLPDALNSLVRLIPLNDTELLRAIERPPEIEGTVCISSELPGEILRDLRQASPYGMGEEYVEPGLVQLVCHRLWNEASSSEDRTMDLRLYESFGRADTIVREFIWNELGRAGIGDSHFSASDRVLWSGLTRHLMVAQGVKSIFTPAALSRKIRLEDLGLAGPATVSKILPKECRKYLLQVPEKRGEPSSELESWISQALAKGVRAGFLKQQRGSQGIQALFELSHDSLGPVLQQFCVEFESWIRARFAVFMGILMGALIIMPWFTYSLMKHGFTETINFLIIGVIFLVLYFVVIWILIKIGNFLWSLIGFPIIRRLSRGEVPLRGAKYKLNKAIE